MIGVKVALRPESEAPRTTMPGLRGTTNYFSSNSQTDSVTVLRLQRLLAIGINGFRADLIVHLAWGEAR